MVRPRARIYFFLNTSPDLALCEFQAGVILHKQGSQAGIHRPPMAGIHGRKSKSSFSIVLFGAYQEDKDFGNNFLYSGCGGKRK